MEFMYGHDPNLHGAEEATRGECGRGVGKLIVPPAADTHIRWARYAYSLLTYVRFRPGYSALMTFIVGVASRITPTPV